MNFGKATNKHRQNQNFKDIKITKLSNFNCLNFFVNVTIFFYNEVMNN